MGGTIHLQKLAFGLRDVDALKKRVKQRAKTGGGRHVVLTRMTPKRADELRDGGSLYWVVKGSIRARQAIVAVETFDSKGRKGGKRCRLVLEPEVVETERVVRKAFQGWRYLVPSEAPRDLTQPVVDGELDPMLGRELAELGLL